MSVELFLNRRLVASRADAATLGAALIALRGRGGGELELAGERHSLLIEQDKGGLSVSLVDDVGGGEHITCVPWDAAVEAAAEFLAGLPGREGGLLADLREPVWHDDCPACRAMRDGRL